MLESLELTSFINKVKFIQAKLNMVEERGFVINVNYVYICCRQRMEIYVGKFIKLTEDME